MMDTDERPPDRGDNTREETGGASPERVMLDVMRRVADERVAEVERHVADLERRLALLEARLP